MPRVGVRGRKREDSATHPMTRNMAAQAERLRELENNRLHRQEADEQSQQQEQTAVFTFSGSVATTSTAP